MDQTAVPQRRRQQALPVLRPVLHGVLSAAPEGDHQRGLIVHRPGEAHDRAGRRRHPGPAAPRAARRGTARASAQGRARASGWSLWDRIRLLLLFVIVWLIIVWASMADNPLLPFVDAARIQLVDSQWLLWLAGLELLRQIHFFVSERSAALPPVLVAEGVRRLRPGDRTAGSPTGRASGSPGCSRSSLFLALFAVVAAEILDTSPILALFAGARAALAGPAADPAAGCSRSSSSRSSSSGCSGCSPGAASTPTTRTTSTPASPTSGARTTWSQRVKENIVFLENPDAIEAQGRLRARPASCCGGRPAPARR